MTNSIDDRDKKEYPDFSGEPQKYDSYIIEQTLLRDELTKLDSRQQGIYRRFGLVGPKIGVEGEDFDVILADIDAERERIKGKVASNIRLKWFHSPVGSDSLEQYSNFLLY